MKIMNTEIIWPVMFTSTTLEREQIEYIVVDAALNALLRDHELKHDHLSNQDGGGI